MHIYLFLIIIDIRYGRGTIVNTTSNDLGGAGVAVV